MHFGSLFAGIGGFDFGLERAGMECRWQVENDPYCNKVLAKHWPNVRRYEDVREVHGVYSHAKEPRQLRTKEPEDDGENRLGGRGLNTTDLREEGAHEACPSCLPAVDLICGGFPCQPFSVAGKQRGAEDDRHLWPEMFRIIQEVRPRWVLGENVAGLIRLGLDEVLSDLESADYETQSFVIPACAVDAPHRRDRIWLVAYSYKNCESTMSEHGGKGCGELGEDVAHADGQRGRLRYARREDAEDAWQPPGSEGGRFWLPEPNVGRVAHGVPKRVDRLRCLGNAVVPQVVERIGQAILAAEDMT